MGVVIDYWEWRRKRARLGVGGTPMYRRARAVRGREKTHTPVSIGDLSAELLRLIKE